MNCIPIMFPGFDTRELEVGGVGYYDFLNVDGAGRNSYNDS